MVGPAGEVAQEGESTPGQHCLHCGIPIGKARHGGVKVFCCAKHRTAYREAQIQSALAQVQQAIQEMRDYVETVAGEMEQRAAKLDGCVQLLQRARSKKGGGGGTEQG